MSPETRAYPPALIEEFDRLIEECSMCYQCGCCTSSCPSARDLYRGPRRLVRLVLAGEIAAVLSSDDLWRCTECGACTDNCRMDIDVASVLRRLRVLGREHGVSIRCPERAAAQIATRRLLRKPRMDNLQFGMAMAAQGHVPKDLVGAAGAVVKIARQWLPASREETPKAMPTEEAVVTLPFYAGCSLPQDGELHGVVYDVAAGFGVRLEESPEAGCCGHPSRGVVGSLLQTEARVYTACPACDASLKEAGIEAVPVWDALAEQVSRRPDLALRAAGPAFVPYVGCLADRDVALASLAGAAEQAGAEMRLAYPSLHSGCCGALGGMYRGATKASALLLEFARSSRAPIVTTCIVCRDNLRSAARELKLGVPVHLWPEFFRAAPHTPEERTRD